MGIETIRTKTVYVHTYTRACLSVCGDRPNRNKPINETAVSVFIDYYILVFFFLKLGLPYTARRANERTNDPFMMF